MATLVTLYVSYEDDYYKALWVHEGTFLGAVREVNKFNNGNFGSKLEIKGANYIDDFNMYSQSVVEEMRAANISLSLNDFIVED